MAGWGEDPNATLRGLWGTLVNSAAQGQTTAEVWQSLKDAASSWAQNTLGLTLGRTPTADEISAGAQRLLGGVTIRHVNTWRSEAGRWVKAQNVLQGTPTNVQIGGDAVFRRNQALWGGNRSVIPTYRIRVKYSFTVGKTAGEEWSTYHLGGPLTSIDDIQQEVRNQFAGKSYNRNTTMGDWLNFAIEEI